MTTATEQERSLEKAKSDPSSVPARASDVAPVGRLAPSPTGELHLGHARTFLMAWWYTKSRGGKVRLRIDDLDTQRVRREGVEQVMRDLEWLGLTWEGPVVYQSERQELYYEAAQSLVRRGLAFPCTCSRADLERAQSAPHAEDAELRYPGTCRLRSLQDVEGSPNGYALRFKVSQGLVCVKDAVFGESSFDVAGEVGDFVILRRDKAASYQLATVVDDHAQGVTEVVRASDLLPSAARQMLLDQALGYPVPNFAHVPMVVDASGQRLAKRRASLSLQALRARGTDPRQVVTWVAQSVGIEASELVSPEQVTHQFALDQLSRSPILADENAVFRTGAG